MAFYDTADFIDAFRNGGCFIFEGEEDDNEESNDSTDEVTERESSDDTPAEPDDGTPDEETPTEQPKQDDPVPPTENTQAADPDAVNTDDNNKGKQTFTADQIVQEFKKSGAEKATLQYAMSKLKGGRVSLQEGTSGAQTITLRMLLPYIKAGIEKFCQKQSFATSVSEMAKAVMAELKSLSAAEVQKQKAKAAEVQKQAAQKKAQPKPQEKQPQQPSGGSKPSSEPPSDQQSTEDVAPPSA